MNESHRRNLVALYTILTREIRRITRIWPQTLLPPVITTALYFVIFGALIGRRIGTMEGYPYMDFIVPGLILMAVITNSYANVVSSFFSAKFQRHIEEMLVAPVANSIILLGFIGGGVARGLAVGVVVTIVALLFTDLSVHNLGVTLLIAVLTATLFSLGGFINAMYARSFDDVSIVPTFVLTPLTYLGGVFYSLTLLPEFWRSVSLANPIVYMVSAFRYGVLGYSDVPLWISFAIIAAFIAVFFAVCVRLLRTGRGLRA